ncbi:hypothetical protein BP5796_06947 [Coleophoma crateriformis]|uniref:Uncharacterized protein n=1 Tax=Coleophoma crateriformis TaxID=565419 RepID=A0A3D8RQA7_9HELO|nr:hypothetical protein BP5796_06947 [Coleophoma crateriformis]
MPGSNEQTFHIPDSIPVGKFHEHHKHKKEEGADDTHIDTQHDKAGLQEVTDMKKGDKQNEGMKAEEAGLAGQPHGSA